MNTDELVAHGRARFEHAAAKRLLKEKYQAKLIFAHAGGMWRAGPELQITLMSCPNDQAVILDLYENPIQIDVAKLLKLSQERWQEQMTAWLAEFENNNRKR